MDLPGEGRLKANLPRWGGCAKQERTSNIPVTDTIHFYVSGSGEKFTIIRDYANKIIQVKFLAHCKTHSK